VSDERGYRDAGVRRAWDGGCRGLVPCVGHLSVCLSRLSACLYANIKLEWAKTKTKIASSARLALGLALDLGSSDR